MNTNKPLSSLDLRRVYEAPFLERAGRLPLGQASKLEEAGLTVTGHPKGETLQKWAGICNDA